MHCETGHSSGTTVTNGLDLGACAGDVPASLITLLRIDDAIGIRCNCFDSWQEETTCARHIAFIDSPFGLACFRQRCWQRCVSNHRIFRLKTPVCSRTRNCRCLTTPSVMRTTDAVRSSMAAVCHLHARLSPEIGADIGRRWLNPE